MCCKRWVFNSLKDQQLYQKETPAYVLSRECSKSFSDSFFFRTTPATAFEVTLKKESAEIAFALISLFHVQI